VKRFSQEEAMAALLPAIEVAGSVFRKWGEVEAVEAAGGEHIVTITDDGRETDNTAQQGDFIVTNPTHAAERYVVRRDVFLARYEPVAANRWRPTGMVRAVCITAEEPFALQGAWGEDMPVKPGDYLAAPWPALDEVYRIAGREFAEVYEPAPLRPGENVSP